MSAPRTIETLAIGDIGISAGRIGYFDAAHAARLGADMAANGQHDPIHVKRNGNAAKLPWRLVAGLHRLRGAAGAGLVTIDAIKVADTGASDAELRRLELSENLDHRHRRPIERAIFMVERARQEEAIDHPGRVGEARHDRGARVRWDACDTMSYASGWLERTAAAMDCGPRQLQRYQRLHRAIVEELPDLAEPLNFHPLGESFSAMMEVATFKHADARRLAAETIISNPDWPNVRAALVAAGLAESNGNRVDQAKLGTVMRDAWHKLPLTGRREHVEWLVENVTPGMAVDMVAGFKRRGLLP